MHEHRYPPAVSLQEAAIQREPPSAAEPSKRPRLSSKPLPKRPDFGDGLVDEFASGASSASRVGQLIYTEFSFV